MHKTCQKYENRRPFGFYYKYNTSFSLTTHTSTETGWDQAQSPQANSTHKSTETGGLYSFRQQILHTKMLKQKAYNQIVPVHKSTETADQAPGKFYTKV